LRGIYWDLNGTVDVFSEFSSLRYVDKLGEVESTDFASLFFGFTFGFEVEEPFIVGTKHTLPSKYHVYPFISKRSFYDIGWLNVVHSLSPLTVPLYFF
jgi:hypothetical protein